MLNVPIQVLLCSERHFYLRDYVWYSSAIKLIVRTQKHPNLECLLLSLQTKQITEAMVRETKPNNPYGE